MAEYPERRMRARKRFTLLPLAGKIKLAHQQWAPDLG
jgi:hypothetical protein